MSIFHSFKLVEARLDTLKKAERTHTKAMKVIVVDRQLVLSQYMRSLQLLAVTGTAKKNCDS